MKKLLLLFVAVVFAQTGIMAQKFETLPVQQGVLEQRSMAAAKGLAAPKRVELEANQQLLGAYDTDEYVTDLRYSSGLPRYPGNITVANVFTADDLMPFYGGQIVAMRVAFAMDQDLATFFIAAIDHDGNINTVFEKPAKSLKAGWTDMQLTTPYTIEKDQVEGLLLGFTYTQVNTNDGQYYDDACYPLSIVSAGSKDYTLLAKGLSGTDGWVSLGTGNLSVQAFVTGTYATNAVMAYDFGSVLVPFGSTNTATVQLRNLGTAGISNIDYTVAVDGVASEEQHYALPSKFSQFNGYTTFYLTLQSAQTEGTEQRVLTITKVNGLPNELLDQAQATGLVASTSKKATPHVVVEEFTGTGCGWCPRGLVGMEKARQALGEKFVGIGLHQYNSSDPMYLSAYAPLEFSGAPSCTVNRQFYTDPYYGYNNRGIVTTCQMMLDLPCMADISVAGSWSADGTQVEATAEVSTLVDGADYQVEFVLIADGLTGTASSWKQGNYYSSAYSSSTGVTQASLPDDLKFLWTAGTSYAPEFNDVALVSSYSGGANQVPQLDATSSATPSQVSYTLTLPTKQPLAGAIKKDQVYVVAILVNPSDGTVINAAKSLVGSTNSLKAITAPATAATAARFALDGTRLATPRKGLNIVRTADGRTIKVIQTR